MRDAVSMMSKSQSDTVLARFSSATRRWFSAAFAAPTPVQKAAWQAIASGEHALVIAPTGSGKTLAAFLTAIDTLFQVRTDQPAPTRESTTRILYISPVKALAADVQRNLNLPLAGVYAERQALNEPEITLNIGMRSGDTPSAERARLLRRPPDILITTPESLFLMLTSKARTTLQSITTVIVDEVHAVAGSKRGSQLALSLERLDALLPQPAQRIGLSATVRPVERVAAFLGGCQPVQVVNPAADRTLHLTIDVPVEDMTDIASADDLTGEASTASGSIWPHIEARILQQVMAHRATLVFVNSRGLAEKLTARLNARYLAQQIPAENQDEERAGDLIARSHHGSVSKEQRGEIEAALKQGRLRCVVATSSLELGIDMGPVDLVIQVGAPLSVASALQRVGRAGHQVGGISTGILYPRTRRDLLDSAVILQSMRAGHLDALAPPRNPLDILAQQTLAAVAMDPLQADDWYAQVCRADPFRTLSRRLFNATLDMLAGKFPSDAFAQLRPQLVWDRQSGVLTARPGAQNLAVTSGGTIPDRGMFSVILPEGEEQAGSRRVGELDEEMVYESRVNDIITLGATSWRIQQITHDQVLVVPAPGRPARLPFWRGEGIGRSADSGASLGMFLRKLNSASPDDAQQQLHALGLNAHAVTNLLALLAEQRVATGVLPDDRTLLIERCRDETGDWRVILHSPWGKRVNAPWALAISARIQHRMGLDASVAASDDGIVARFPASEGHLPGADLFMFDADQLTQDVTQSVGQSALFAARFRECASRALLLPGRNPGKRSPLWQQRLRAGQLLAVARQYDDFPILIETARECLQDVYDLPALHQLMEQLAQGNVKMVEVTTEQPSPFAAPLLFGYVAEFIYASDAPQAERRASLLALDSNLLGELLGQTSKRDLLAPDVVEQVGQELQRIDSRYQAQHAEGIIDLLRDLGPLSVAGISARFSGNDQQIAEAVSQFAAARRVIPVTVAGEARWAVIEDAARLRDALGTELPDDLPDTFLEPQTDPLRDLVNRYARTNTLFTARQLATHLGLGVAIVNAVLLHLYQQGSLLNTGAAAGTTETEWVSSEIFKRLRLRSLQAAREATRPVSPAAWVSLLLTRHGLLNRAHQGVSGLLRVIEQLAGVPLPASLWESQILRARIADYQPAMLDELLVSGEVIWCGHKALGQNDGLISLHLSEFAAETLPEAEATPPLTPIQQAILEALSRGGAWFVHEIMVQMGAPETQPSDVYDSLWQLVWQGYVTADSWIAVRGLLTTPGVTRSRPARTLRTRFGQRFTPGALPARRPAVNTLAGRWSKINRQEIAPARLALSLAENLLDRYGVITRGSAVSEQIPGGFPALQPVLRSMEDAGRLLRGQIVAGSGGAQFADYQTIEQLRALAEAPTDVTEAVTLAALDPANPFGAMLSWPVHASGIRPTRRQGARVVIAGGMLMLFLTPGGKELLTFSNDLAQLETAVAALGVALKREKPASFTLETVDGEAVSQSPLLNALRHAGFSRVPQGFSWYS
ncbi:ATP-dependent helicase [Pantoea sp. Bo_2]|nr:ATP-dependent helicase [Pantoea sp. VH_3]KAA5950226.1 ATP-dependent helicase [Pantoea sp. VH_25]KAA5955924.1 ATP-dependent helicase [Pantoea sp. VH_16]KAA5958056.1 ATP-dependent helicase [Pantoea sp. VH_24]KAA5962964.1 ATP-dependent helicase [Pantoea sp. VH_18]KAA5979949.1 ATP-dependent helicase [Pantoea sp. M_3]KAA5996477.1 ATP-dependent helicase [Pantoea sp. M_1]KAA5999462.1 ATP-dependent helicase [Pantoea sp. F_7]KAA6007592.1 ATP-dependent helicase [Pantoea sp. F_18]KAA6009331.1 ATP-